MYDLLARPMPDASPDASPETEAMTEVLTGALTGAREALLRLERAPVSRADLLHARHLVHRVEAACRRLDLAGSERAAAAAGRALDRARSDAPAVPPDLVTGLLRALDHAGTAVAAPRGVGVDQGNDATGIIEALDALVVDSAGRFEDAADPTVPVPTTLLALIVEVDGQRFAIPRASVVDLAEPGAPGGSPPLVSLSDVLRLPRAACAGAGAHVLVAAGAGALGLAVDRVLDTCPVAARPSAPILRRNSMLGGSAALSGGEVVMILNVDGIVAAVEVARESRTEPPTDPSAPDAAPGVSVAWDPPRPLVRAREDGGPRVLLVEERGFAGVSARRTPQPCPDTR